MNTILILDKDAKTRLSEDLKERILKILKEKAHQVEVDVVHPGLDKQVDVYLTTSSDDSEAICEAFKKYV